MHPAHPMVGVSRSLGIFRPSRSQDDFSIVGSARSLTVTLVSGDISGHVAATLGSLRRMLRHRLNAECRFSFIDLAEGFSELDHLETTDCAVLLHQGITILQSPSQWRLDLFGDSHPNPSGQPMGEMEVVPASPHHPLLDGVAAFATQSDPFVRSLPADGICLLLGRTNDANHPVAWARDTDDGRQFHTSLGSSDDLRQPSFCRILVNAVDWIAKASAPGT